MQELSVERTKSIYRAAVDARASDAEGDAWWAAVHTELRQVLEARTTAEAARFIAWWHSDWEWRAVGDTAKATARRIRSAARAACSAGSGCGAACC